VREFLTVEFPGVRLRKPDFLGRLENNDLVHLEWQGDNEERMEWRELEYYQLICDLFQQQPIQWVLYFGNEPLTMKSFIAHRSLNFQYTLLDVRWLNHQPLQESESLADRTLSVLFTERLTLNELRAVTDSIAALPRREQRDWFEKLMILAGVRGAGSLVSQEAEKMGLDIRDHFLYREGEIDLLRQMLERRFGNLPKWVSRLLAQSDREQLSAAGLRLLDAQTLKEVFQKTPPKKRTTRAKR
jgi:hypothetical protein